jgi:hypothetical protein
MRNDGQAILRLLLPTLVVLSACGRAEPPGSTTAGRDGAAGAAAANGSAGSTGSGGLSGVAGLSGVDRGGAGGDAGTTGTAGAAATDAGGTTGTAGGSDGGAADGDGGPDAQLPPDAGSKPDAGTRVPPYDGGIVSVINAGNWNETTIHPFSQRRMLVRDQGNPHLVLLDFGNPTPVAWKTSTGTGGALPIYARGMQLIGNNQVLGGTGAGYQVFDLTDGHIVKTVSGFGNTQSAYRMANGETMLTQSGTVLTFLDKNDNKTHQISYPGFAYVRLARPTRNGTFLVPSDTTLFEGDATGKVLWTTTSAGWVHIWEPLLMSDGNVLLATAFGSSLDVVDRNTHMVTKSFNTKTMAATFGHGEFTEFQVLPNGNLITPNFPPTGGGAIQVIEFNPAGDVVWFYKQDPTVFSGIQAVMVIDGMDPKFLHAQEISADSTWQPVIPTP